MNNIMSNSKVSTARCNKISTVRQRELFKQEGDMAERMYTQKSFFNAEIKNQAKGKFFTKIPYEMLQDIENFGAYGILLYVYLNKKCANNEKVIFSLDEITNEVGINYVRAKNGNGFQIKHSLVWLLERGYIGIEEYGIRKWDDKNNEHERYDGDEECKKYEECGEYEECKGYEENYERVEENIKMVWELSKEDRVYVRVFKEKDNDIIEKKMKNKFTKAYYEEFEKISENYWRKYRDGNGNENENENGNENTNWNGSTSVKIFNLYLYLKDKINRGNIVRERDAKGEIREDARGEISRKTEGKVRGEIREEIRGEKISIAEMGRDLGYSRQKTMEYLKELECGGMIEVRRGINRGENTEINEYVMRE